MNRIEERQSSEEAIKIIAAFRTAYKKAKFWKALLWTLTFLLSTIQIVATIQKESDFPEDWAPALVSIALIVMLLSTFGQEFKIKHHIKIGSTLQRLHDHTVLGLGQRPSSTEIRPSKIENLSAMWLKDHPSDHESLKEWWPNCVSKLPEHLAQALCLMSTFNWALELRKKYLATITLLTLLMAAALIFISIVTSMSTKAFILTLITPASPFFGLAIGEIISNLEASKSAQLCSHEIQKAWNEKDALTEEQMREKTSELAFLWESYRSKSTPIFEWLYSLTRKTMNDDMLVDAEKLTSEYLKNR